MKAYAVCLLVAGLLAIGMLWIVSADIARAKKQKTNQLHRCPVINEIAEGMVPYFTN